MKYAALAIAMAMIILATNASAQGKGNGYGNGPGKGEPNIEKMIELLELSDTQVEQWKEIHEKYKPQFDELKDDENLSRSEKWDSMKEIAEKRDEEIKEILNDEQWDKFTEMRKERRVDMRRNYKRRMME